VARMACILASRSDQLSMSSSVTRCQYYSAESETRRDRLIKLSGRRPSVRPPCGVRWRTGWSIRLELPNDRVRLDRASSRPRLNRYRLVASTTGDKKTRTTGLSTEEKAACNADAVTWSTVRVQYGDRTSINLEPLLDAGAELGTSSRRRDDRPEPVHAATADRLRCRSQYPPRSSVDVSAPTRNVSMYFAGPSK